MASAALAVEGPLWLTYESAVVGPPTVKKTINFCEKSNVRLGVGLSHRLDDQLARMLAAGSASAMSVFLFHPIDTLRVRWQLASAKISSGSISGVASRSLMNYGLSVTRKEGLVEGLWRPGVTANVSGFFFASALRFGYYETVRDTLSGMDVAASERRIQKRGRQGSTGAGAVHMAASGIICGSVGYAAMTPFQLVKTRAQASRGRGVGLVKSLLSLASKEGFKGLYRGWALLAARGSLHGAGQMAGYDGVKTFARDGRLGVRDGPALQAIASVAASISASLLSAPADLLITRYMTLPGGTRLVDCIRGIYREGGGSITVFWRGWTLSFIRLTPVMMTFTTLYEQFRFQLGVGYL